MGGPFSSLGGDDDDNSSSSSSSNSSSEPTGSTEPYEPDDDEMMEPDDPQISDGAHDKVAEQNEREEDAGSEGTLSEYKSVQKEKIRDSLDDIVDIADDHSGSVDEFTVIMQMNLINWAQYRIGVCDVLRDEFGMSKRKAKKETNKMFRECAEEKEYRKMIEALFDGIV